MKEFIKIFIPSIAIGYCIGSFIGIFIGNYLKDTDTNKENVIITPVYNKQVIDSIEYNIKKKDSVIVILKKKVIYEMEKAINVDDSAAIEQFKQLAGAKD